jgi:quercetin dioxygenase-like cupin family protein
MKTRALNVSNPAKPVAQTRYLRRLAAVACSTLFGSALLVGQAWATPSRDVVGEPLAPGSLLEPVRVKFKDDFGGFGDGTAVAQISVIKYTVQPGGYFGWHTHGGPVWVVVAAGTLTLYDGDDATCSAHSHPAGSAFLDPGGGHVHNARNEGTVPVVVYATFLLPAGAPLRIDVPASPNPGVCGF